MKIIVISDTHIKHGSIIECLQPELIELIKDADMVIHAGDFVTKKAYDELSSITQLLGVHGNSDDTELKKLLPERASIKIEGIKIGVIHEATLSIHDLTGAGYMAKEMGVDVLIFGHIHKPLIKKSDILLICPGSPIAPRLSEPSAVELFIENEKISGKIMNFEGTVCSSIKTAESFRNQQT